MAFNLPNQTSFAQPRPINAPTSWTRPSDWITITDAPNIIQFLVSDLMYPTYSIQTTFTQTGGVGNIYINWGDGTSTTVSTTTATNSEKTYTSGGTPCSLGYNTWKITISGDVGTRITLAVFTNPTYWGSANAYNTGLLEEYYGDNTIIDLTGLHYTASPNRPTFFSLQYSKLPSVMTGSTTMNEAYYNCQGLQKVVLPTSMPGCTATSNSFYFCNVLQNIVFPQDLTGSTTFNQTFASNFCLTGVTLPPSLTSVTNCNGTFQSCFSLKSVILPTGFGAVTTFTSMFSGCYQLLSVELKDFGTYTGGTIDLGSMFSSCRSLEYVKFPTTVLSTQVFNGTNMFLSDGSLKTVTLPTNMTITNLSSAFQNCSSLSYVSIPLSQPLLTTLNQTFSSCLSLPSVTLPTTVAASIDLNSCFNGCSAMSTISIPSSYNITSMNSTFFNCNIANSITLPTTAQNSISTLQSAFQNCYQLKTVTLPSSMTGVTSMQSMFVNNYNLTGVTFPSTMNLCTSMASTFSATYNLTNVTLPTSMSTCSSFNSSFSSNYRIQSVTLPTTISSAGTSFTNAFSNCWTLKNIVLPTTQIITPGDFSAVFANCYSLTGITNFNKIGNPATTGSSVNMGTVLQYAFELVSSLTAVTKLSKIGIYGQLGVRNSRFSSLRLSNTGSGQWGGTSPQIDISYTNLSTAALNLLFADMAAQGNVTSKTINITGALGAAGLSAADRLVITSKGWTITG